MFLAAIVLGLIQGLTEFIPVSSSGHLLLVERLLGWDTSKLVFDVALHWGTLVALIAFFWRDWVSILRSFAGHVFCRQPYGKPDDVKGYGRLLVPIVVASIPAAVAGIGFEHKIEAWRGSAWIVAAIASALIGVGLLMLLAERVGRKQRETGSMNYADYIVIGAAQALALFPGVSRSGITISAGLFRNLDRTAAARFSFLLSTPAVFGAGLLALKDIVKQPMPSDQWAVLGVGFATAAVSGFIAIGFLMKYLQRGSVAVFAVYRIALALAVLGTLWHVAR